MWDSHTLQCLRTLEGHEDNVRVLAVGERFLYSGSWDKSIRCAPPTACRPCEINFIVRLIACTLLSDHGLSLNGMACLCVHVLLWRMPGTCATERSP